MKNPAALFKLQGMWKTFTEEHPKFPLFLDALMKTGVQEGTVIEISVTPPEGGEPLRTNIKITEEDLRMFEELRELA